MNTLPRIVNYFRIGDTVALVYDDYDVLFVRNRDFNRAFGCILNASKDDVLRDFVVDRPQKIVYRGVRKPLI